jgi:hypothetical protein
METFTIRLPIIQSMLGIVGLLIFEGVTRRKSGIKRVSTIEDGAESTKRFVPYGIL